MHLKACFSRTVITFLFILSWTRQFGPSRRQALCSCSLSHILWIKILSCHLQRQAGKEKKRKKNNLRPRTCDHSADCDRTFYSLWQMILSTLSEDVASVCCWRTKSLDEVLNTKMGHQRGRPPIAMFSELVLTFASASGRDSAWSPSVICFWQKLYFKSLVQAGKLSFILVLVTILTHLHRGHPELTFSRFTRFSVFLELCEQRLKVQQASGGRGSELSLIYRVQGSASLSIHLIFLSLTNLANINDCTSVGQCRLTDWVAQWIISKGVV